MSSAHIDQQTTEYLDGTLSPTLTQKVKSHIIFCNACRQYLNQIEVNIQHLKTLPKRPPSKNLKADVLAYLANKTDEKSRASAERPPQSDTAPTSGFSPKIMASVIGVLIIIGAVIARRYTNEPGTAPITVEKPAVETPALSATKPPEKPAEETPKKSVSLDERPHENPPMVKKVDPAPVPVPAPVKSVPLTVLTGGTSGVSDERAVVLSNEKSWNDLWKDHSKNQKTATPPPEVDFAENDVIAIFGGNQPSAGYSIKVKKVQDTTWEGNPARVVYYWVQKPASGAITASVISQPFYFKTVKRLSGKTYFKKLAS